MKKVLLCMLLVSIVFFAVPKTDAETNSMVDAIFKIQAYSYNKLSDMYVMEQYGSAVLIADNILLTNAHVITDSNNGLTLQYEACQTVSEQEAPKCFSTLQLLKYDKNADLALLQIVDLGSDMPDPIVMGSGALSVGSAVRVIGYPANGGNTITTTQGTIAGFENKYYKTDANIDEGNSGGGTFDSAGNFIGIPTYVINGQTTMGYIIPTNTIQSFIAGGFGTTYKQKYSAVFDKWLKSIYAIQTAGIIENTLFSTPNFSDIGLKLDIAIEKKNNNFYSYSLSNDNDNTIDVLSLIATDNAAIGKYINNTMKNMIQQDLSPKKTSKRIGTNNRSVISFGQDDRVGYDYIQTTSTNKTYLEFVVLVDKADGKDLVDLIGFVENTTIKKSYSKAQIFNLPVIKLSSKWNVGIVKWFETDGLSISLYPTNEKYVADISTYMGEKGDTLKSITSQLKNLYDSAGLTTASETSKYPGTASIIRVVDENNKTSLNILGVKRYGGNNMFVYITINLTSTSAKQEAITLGYKILGLE